MLYRIIFKKSKQNFLDNWTIRIRIFWRFRCREQVKCAFIFWFDHSLGARAEICQIFTLLKNFILKLSDLSKAKHCCKNINLKAYMKRFLNFFLSNGLAAQARKSVQEKNYLLETIWIDDHKLNYDLISMSLKSNYDVIICTCVSYFLLFLIGWSKAGSTNENLAPPGGAKCN